MLAHTLKEILNGIFTSQLFEICRKFGISYASASEKERAFVSEVARVTYEIDKAKRDGRPTSSVRPAFTPA